MNRRQNLQLALIDDDRDFLAEFSKQAEAADWQLHQATVAVPPHDLVAMKLDALLLDPAVLGDGGWGYLEHVCEMLPDLGLIVCTGRTKLERRVSGLRLGVDDWATKPMHPKEAMARVEAVSRGHRSHAEADSCPFVTGELEVHPDRFQAFLNGESLDLTRLEFELLQLLARAQGQVFERETIYNRVWGYAMVPGDRSVDVFIRKLRQKLAIRSPGWGYIHTHFGIGYRFEPEPVATAESGDNPPVRVPAKVEERTARLDPVALS